MTAGEVADHLDRRTRARLAAPVVERRHGAVRAPRPGRAATGSSPPPARWTAPRRGDRHRLVRPGRRARRGGRAPGARVTQLTPASYRSPAALPDGGVLVVGASASGAQLADELAAARPARSCSPSAPTPGCPARYRGRDILWWLDADGHAGPPGSTPPPGPPRRALAAAGRPHGPAGTSTCRRCRAAGSPSPAGWSASTAAGSGSPTTSARTIDGRRRPAAAACCARIDAYADAAGLATSWRSRRRRFAPPRTRAAPHRADLRAAGIRHRALGDRLPARLPVAARCRCWTTTARSGTPRGVTAAPGSVRDRACACRPAATRPSSTVCGTTPPRRRTGSSPTRRARPDRRAEQRRGGRSTEAARGAWDVVVVGARVAGAATALLLARAGLRVLVLDRARPGSDTVSTHALMRGRASLQLHRWGLLDRVARRRHAAGPPHRLPLRRRAHRRSRSSRRPVSTRCTPPAAPCSTACSPTRRPTAGADGPVRHRRHRPVPRPDGRVIGVLTRDRRGRGRDRAGRPGDRRRRPRSLVAGRGRRAGPARRPGVSPPSCTATGPTCRRRLRVVLPARRQRRGHPHQRRLDLRVRRRPPGRDGSVGRRRGSRRCRTVAGRPGPLGPGSRLPGGSAGCATSADGRPC